jgi:hypothetical protein
MNKTFPEAEELLVAIAEGLDDMPLETDVVIVRLFLIWKWLPTYRKKAIFR